jgi:hypothetical protein
MPKFLPFLVDLIIVKFVEADIYKVVGVMLQASDRITSLKIYRPILHFGPKIAAFKILCMVIFVLGAGIGDS